MRFPLSTGRSPGAFINAICEVLHAEMMRVDRRGTQQPPEDAAIITKIDPANVQDIIFAHCRNHFFRYRVFACRPGS